MIEDQAELSALREEFLRKQGYKWYFLFMMCCFVGVLLYTAIVPGFNYVFVKSQPNKVLMDSLDFLEAGDLKLADAVTDDFMTLAWNLNDRDPYVLTKKTIAEDAEQDLATYDSLKMAAFLSAVNPEYFLPYQDLADTKNKDKVFISGNAVAQSHSEKINENKANMINAESTTKAPKHNHEQLKEQGGHTRAAGHEMAIFDV